MKLKCERLDILNLIDYDRVEAVWFPGNKRHPAMIWGIVQRGSIYLVIESYDNGKTWTINCDFPSRKSARNFVYSWLDDTIE